MILAFIYLLFVMVAISFFYLESPPERRTVIFFVVLFIMIFREPFFEVLRKMRK